MITFTPEHKRELSRWTVNQESIITSAGQFRRWQKNKGLFYHKGLGVGRLVLKTKRGKHPQWRYNA